jgi:hypothetical protein
VKKIILTILLLVPLSAFAEEWRGITVPEETRYYITYFGILAGYSSIRIEKTQYQGKAAVKITGTVRTTKFFSFFYRVEDTMVSIIDAETFQPLEHKVDYSEGSYRRKTDYVFDYRKGECRSAEGVVPIKDDILDPLGALFYLRVQPLEKGQVIRKEICHGRGVQLIEAAVEGMKKIFTRDGKKNAFMVRPVLKEVKMEGVTSVKENVVIYFLEEGPKLPYVVSGKLVIGSLVARLNSVGPGEKK